VRNEKKRVRKEKKRFGGDFFRWVRVNTLLRPTLKG
jgi:hypothetical protein